MPVRQGVVLSVEVIPHAGGLSSDVPAGSTALPLMTVEGFSPDGGAAIITQQTEDDDITEPIAYGGVDLETNTLQLIAPLVFSYEEGADVVGKGETTWVTVDLGEEEEPVPAELSHSLKTTTALAEGIRVSEDAETVLIDEVSGRWFLIEVIGQQNLLDGGAIDPSTQIPGEALPPPGPTDPPSESPTIVVVPYSRSLNVYAQGPQPDIWTTLVFEVARDAGFTNMVQAVRTRSTAATIAPTPDRTDLYVRVTAENELGSAPPSPVVGPVRTMLIESVDVADFGLTVKKFLSSTHMLY